MEALRDTKRPRTVTLTFPGNDYSLLRSITSRMGWTITPAPRKRKTRLERAMEDAEAGRVFAFDSVEEMWEHLNSEEYTPNSCTLRAMQEVRAGKVFHAESAEDLIHQILG